MTTTEVKYTSNVAAFLLKHRAMTKQCLVAMASSGVKAINNQTPVKSGNLKSRNRSDIRNEWIYFTNDADYARYVELGTMYKDANPFMRRGIQVNKYEFLEIIKKELRV